MHLTGHEAAADGEGTVRGFRRCAEAEVVLAFLRAETDSPSPPGSVAQPLHK
jgi:hypothetical protein